jgi:fibrillarin-like rRNA methylase
MSTVTLSDIHTEELIFPVEFNIEYLSEFKAVRKKRSGLLGDMFYGQQLKYEIS